jgi:hypothetical protein
MAKDVLGAAVTLAVIGAFLLQATNRLPELAQISHLI